MSFLDFLLGRDHKETKSLEINWSTGIESVVDGYPSWPIHNSYGEIYRKQPAVRTVVDFLSKNVAQLNPKIYFRASATDRVEAPDHPVAELLRRPNPSTTRYGLLRDTVADKAIYDRAYWWLPQNRGRTEAIIRLPASRLRPEWDRERGRTVYRLDSKREFPVSELVIFKGYHPEGSPWGVSALETLRRVLANEWASQVHREFYWRNAARQSGVIERPADAPTWSPEARGRFREQWEEAMTGGHRAGRTAILEDGMKLNLASFSPKDSEYIEGRKLTYKEVARVYAPALASLITEDGPNAVLESSHRHVYQDVFGPLLRDLQDDIDLQLIGRPEFDDGEIYYAEFNLAEKLKGSFEEQQKALTTAVGVPHMTINEARARLNLPRIPTDWADVPVQPMNVLYGGQPAVTVPVGGGEASQDFSDFADRFKAAVLSRLGAVPDHSESSFDLAWQHDRWVKESSKALGSDEVEDFISDLYEDLKSAFSSGGLNAVKPIIDDLTARAADSIS